MDEINKKVANYYGEVLKSSSDLKTSACCSIESIPEYIKEKLALIHPEVNEKFYGCGSPIPENLSGLSVLDLGCGTGRDSFLISALVGEKGEVIGIDMTEEQLEVARQYQEYHREQFGLNKVNTKFIKGNIEDLKACGIRDKSMDLVVSNCVLKSYKL